MAVTARERHRREAEPGEEDIDAPAWLGSDETSVMLETTDGLGNYLTFYYHPQFHWTTFPISPWYRSEAFAKCEQCHSRLILKMT